MIEKKVISVSSLEKTWILDLDGTIVKHNGYKLDGRDTLLEGAKEFLDNISKADKVIFLTSRTEEYKEQTIQFLVENRVRYDYILFGMPYGERVLVNDKKPSGLPMSIAVNTERDQFMKVEFHVNENI